MRRGRSGNVAIELAMWLPFIFLLITGIIQFGKITYVYYTLNKTVHTVATYLAAQNGVNFCDLTGDPTIVNAINFGLTGSTDGSGTATISDLTPDMITVTPRCIDPNNPTGPPIDCVVDGCGTPAGPQRPDMILVSIPNGYMVQPRIPYILLDPIPLKPQAVVPNGGGL